MRARAIVLISLSILIRIDALRGCDIPLEPTRTSFVTAVRIGDAGPFRFLFDTGTTQTVISPEAAGRAGMVAGAATTALSSGGSVETRRGEASHIRIGSLQIERLPMLILALPSFPSHGAIDGIVGMDVLAGHSFLLDARRRCVDLNASPAELSGGSSVAATEIAGRVAIRANGMNFVLDSAASFVVLMSERAAGLASRDGSLEMKSAAGSRQVVIGEIPRLTVGDVALRHVRAVLGAGGDAYEDALLPVTPFATVFVSEDRSEVILNAVVGSQRH